MIRIIIDLGLFSFNFRLEKKRKKLCYHFSVNLKKYHHICDNAIVWNLGRHQNRSFIPLVVLKEIDFDAHETLLDFKS